MGDDTTNVLAQKPGYPKIVLQLVAIVIFALMIVYFMGKYASDISSLQHLSPQDILLIAAWLFVSYTAYACAVYVVLVALGLKRLGPFGWLRIYFASRLANIFVTQGGNVFRLVILKKKFNFSYTNSIGVTVFLIWINALIALFAALLILTGRGIKSEAEFTSLLGWSMLAVLVLMLGPLLIVWLIQYFRKSSIWLSPVLRPFRDIAEFFASTVKNFSLLSQITSLSVAHFFFFVGVNYFCFRAIGQSVGIAAVCLYTTAFVLTRYINIVPGNLGVSELVGGLVSEQMGIGFGNGVLVVGIIRFVEIMIIVLFGVICGQIFALSSFRK